MTHLTPYDREAILIGYVLCYPEAAKQVLPHLTHDKFIYSKEGALGARPDHMYIWQAIQSCVMHKQPINIPTILEHLSPDLRGDFRPYLLTLQDKLSKFYGIHEFDPRHVQGMATSVDKAGVIYRVASKAAKVGTLLSSQDIFEKAITGIDDVDSWVNQTLREFRVTNGHSGYLPIEVFALQALERVEEIEQGKQSTVIPCGIDVLGQAGLFPLRSLSTVHGMSGSGKSAFLFTVCVGTALTLVARKIKGCVAFNSLEMEGRDLALRAASALSGFDLRLLGQDKTSPAYRSFKAWLPIIGKLPLFIDQTSFATTSAIEYRLDSLHTSENGPVWMMGVDYLELHGDERNSRESKEQWLDTIIHNYFHLSRAIGAAVIVLSQSTYGEGSNKYKIAGPGGPRYSQAIRHASDIMAELWNPIYMREAGISFDVPDGLDAHHLWLLIQKNRHGPVGGHIRLGWEPKRTAVWDITSDRPLGDIPTFSHLEEALSSLGVDRKSLGG